MPDTPKKHVYTVEELQTLQASSLHMSEQKRYKMASRIALAARRNEFPSPPRAASSSSDDSDAPVASFPELDTAFAIRAELEALADPQNELGHQPFSAALFDADRYIPFAKLINGLVADKADQYASHLICHTPPALLRSLQRNIRNSMEEALGRATRDAATAAFNLGRLSENPVAEFMAPRNVELFQRFPALVEKILGQNAPDIAAKLAKADPEHQQAIQHHLHTLASNGAGPFQNIKTHLERHQEELMVEIALENNTAASSSSIR